MPAIEPWISRTAPALALGLLALFAFAGCGDAPEAEGAGQASPDDTTVERPVILITGSTGGLGREVALHMGSTGAHIIVHGRNEESGAEVVSAIEAEGIGSAEFHRADLASLDEVRALARTIRETHDRLDVLVNNAGIWLEADDGRLLSEDGHELHFQVNYLSHYLLTRLLLPRIIDAAPARIVNVASGAQQPLDFDNVMLERGYSDMRAYSQSKLAQILFTVDLADELEGTGVTVTTLHPATMMDTGMVLSRGAAPRSSVDEGTAAVLNLVLSKEVSHGAYYNGQQEGRPHRQARDDAARAALRRLSNALTGLPR